MPPAILVVGNAVLDIILEVGHYPAEDEEMRAISRRHELGGNAANTARVLAGLGHEVALLTLLAPDSEADMLESLLAASGIDTRYVRRAPEGRSPLSYILLHQANGTRTIVHHRQLAELTVDDFTRCPHGDYRWIHFEGRNIEQVHGMMRHLRQSGFSGGVSVEIEKARPEIEALIPLANLVLFSRGYAESAAITDAPALLMARRHLGPNAMMSCTWGVSGAWAIDGRGALYHRPAQVPEHVVDTVGAGDVFNAGMIHALSATATLEEALHAAVSLASRKVGQRGFADLMA